MPRTITVRDDDAGVEGVLTLHPAVRGEPARVQSVLVTVLNGRELTPADIGLLFPGLWSVPAALEAAPESAPSNGLAGVVEKKPAPARKTTKAAKPASTKAKAKAAKPASTKTATTRPPTTRGQMAAKGAAAAAAKSGRIYRVRPDDFADTVAQVGETAGVLAEHYKVPRHTAQGWLAGWRKDQARAAAVVTGEGDNG